MTTDWSARWLDLVESSPEFPEAALRRGADYAAFDWQLELDIERGRATTTASSGRLQYEAAISVPTLSSEQIDAIVASIASSTERLAAVLDGELPDDLDHVLDLDPAAIRASCTCRSIDRPCKHAAAVPHLLADAIVEDPFDLLHLRGVRHIKHEQPLVFTQRCVGERPLDHEVGGLRREEISVQFDHLAATARGENDEAADEVGPVLEEESFAVVPTHQFGRAFGEVLERHQFKVASLPFGLLRGRRLRRQRDRLTRFRIEDCRCLQRLRA